LADVDISNYNQPTTRHKTTKYAKKTKADKTKARVGFMFFYMFTCLYFIVCYYLGLLCTSCMIFIINK